MQDPVARSHPAAGTPPEPPPSLRKTALQLVLRMAAALLTLPVAMALTLALHPLWSWLERATGIESMGREGPAAWCYLTVWGLVALAVMAPALWRAGRGAGRRVRTSKNADA